MAAGASSSPVLAQGGVSLSRAQLLALPQHTARLPIACVEGWPTGVQTWTGVRLADLADLAGAVPDAALFVESLQRGGGIGSATLFAGQVRASDALLALQVNGADLSADHGFPAQESPYECSSLSMCQRCWSTCSPCSSRATSSW